MNVAELKGLASGLGITGTGRMRKDELVAAIAARQSGSPQRADGGPPAAGSDGAPPNQPSASAPAQAPPEDRAGHNGSFELPSPATDQDQRPEQPAQDRQAWERPAEGARQPGERREYRDNRQGFDNRQGGDTRENRRPWENRSGDNRQGGDNRSGEERQGTDNRQGQFRQGQGGRSGPLARAFRPCQRIAQRLTASEACRQLVDQLLSLEVVQRPR